MIKKLISPSLADLSQDIAGSVPVDLVQNWIESESTPEHAENILGSYRAKGTLVSSDTSGLSKLSQEKDLLDVLKIISDPKEIVYGVGRSVGGIGVGKWVADNTQMFFPESVEVHQIVSAIHWANQLILKECQVKLGFCIHHGEFLNIGNGFYGEEADFMEELAENHADGGEILITETVANILKNHDGFEFVEKKIEIDVPKKVFSLKSAKSIDDIKIEERDYPIYFDQRFFNHLKKLEEDGAIRDIIYRDYSKPKIVVLIQKRTNIESTGIIGLLDSLVENTIFSAVLKRISKKFNAQEIKIAGSFAIYTFEIDKLETAISFAQEVRSELQKDSLESITGIDSGEVLLFPLEDSTWDIAGDPVNIASKQAQDFGKSGKIYITKKAVGGLKIKNAKPYKTEISKVILEGLEF